MAIKPRPFKICCKNCGFEKIIQFKSDVIDGSDIKQIPQTCPKCGGTELERKSVTEIEARLGTSVQNIANLVKGIFK